MPSAMNKLAGSAKRSMDMVINHMKLFHIRPALVKKIRSQVEDHPYIDQITQFGGKFDGFIKRELDPRIRKTTNYRFWQKPMSHLRRNVDLEAAMILRRVLTEYVIDDTYVLHGLGTDGIKKRGWY